MVTTLAASELNTSGSRYLTVKAWLEDAKQEVMDAMQIVEAEDRARGLYTLQTPPTSLLEYPNIFGQGHSVLILLQGEGSLMPQVKQGATC